MEDWKLVRQREYGYLGGQGNYNDVILSMLAALIEDPNFDNSIFREEDVAFIRRHQKIKTRIPKSYNLEGIRRTRTVYYNGVWRLIVFFDGDSIEIPTNYSTATVVVGSYTYEINLTDFQVQSDRWLYIFPAGEFLGDEDGHIDDDSPAVTINP